MPGKSSVLFATTPLFLKKLGMAYEKTGDFKAAAATYQRIADEYPASIEARDIPKYIGRAEQK